MPAHKRPIPKIALNYELMVAETLGQVGYRHLGMLIRGLCWAVEAGRPWIPRNVMVIYAEDGEEAQAIEDIETLISVGLLVEDEANPKMLRLGEKSWLMIAQQRRPIPKRIRHAVFERDGHQCRRCSSTERLTIDHIKPFSRGGLDDPENLQTLCGPCNSSKGARV